MLMNSTIDCDLLVVGGGLNGTAIARDAAGRGMSVVLCERDDLGAYAVASACGPLHTAVPSLKRQALSTLRKALAERETLMRIAPHAVTPLRLAVPRDDDQQPWRERASRLLADRLAPRQLLPASRHVDLLHHVAGLPLKPQFSHGELVSGCRVDGPRLAVLNAMDAAEAGATILTRTVCDAAQRSGEGWQATLRGPGGPGTLVRSRAMVNATGQWATRFLRSASNVDLPIPLVKCIRLVVRKKLAHPCSYLLRDADGRSVLVLPCENDSTLVIGDGLPHGGEPGAPQVSDAEIERLCDLLNRYFTARTSAADVAQASAGLRLAVDSSDGSAQALPQPHALRLDRDGAPLLSVLGGDAESFRRVAEEAVDQLAPLLGQNGGAWTAQACLPGGTLFGMSPTAQSVLGFGDYLRMKKHTFAWAPPELVERYVHSYGSRTDRLLQSCASMHDLGQEILPGLFEAELHYLIRHEWAQTAEDILWRRTRLGHLLPPGAAATLEGWLAATPVTKAVKHA
jgi:glycerol-3-phosphate dehydrogenase